MNHVLNNTSSRNTYSWAFQQLARINNPKCKTFRSNFV